MREWIDFTRNNVTFRERREDNPPVDKCVFDWTTRIDGTTVMGMVDVSHLVIRRIVGDWQGLISHHVRLKADNVVNGPKREIERRREYEEWKRKGLDAFA